MRMEGSQDCRSTPTKQGTRSPLAGVKRPQDACLPGEGPTPPKLPRTSSENQEPHEEMVVLKGGYRRFARPFLSGCKTVIKKPLRRIFSLSDRFGLLKKNSVNSGVLSEHNVQSTVPSFEGCSPTEEESFATKDNNLLGKSLLFIKKPNRRGGSLYKHCEIPYPKEKHCSAVDTLDFVPDNHIKDAGDVTIGRNKDEEQPTTDNESLGISSLCSLAEGKNRNENDAGDTGPSNDNEKVGDHGDGDKIQLGVGKDFSNSQDHGVEKGLIKPDLADGTYSEGLKIIPQTMCQTKENSREEVDSSPLVPLKTDNVSSAGLIGKNDIDLMKDEESSNIDEPVPSGLHRPSNRSAEDGNESDMSLDSKNEEFEDSNMLNADINPVVYNSTFESSKHLTELETDVQRDIGRRPLILPQRNISPAHFGHGIGDTDSSVIPGLESFINQPPPPPPPTPPISTPPQQPFPPTAPIPISSDIHQTVHHITPLMHSNMNYRDMQQYGAQTDMFMGAALWNQECSVGYPFGTTMPHMAYQSPYLHSDQPIIRAPLPGLQVPDQNFPNPFSSIPNQVNEHCSNTSGIIGTDLPSSVDKNVPESLSEEIRIVSLLLKKKRIAKTKDEADTIQKTIDILFKDASYRIPDSISSDAVLFKGVDSIPKVADGKENCVAHEEPGSSSASVCETGDNIVRRDKYGNSENTIAPSGEQTTSLHRKHSSLEIVPPKTSEQTIYREQTAYTEQDPSHNMNKKEQQGFSGLHHRGRTTERNNKHKKKSKVPPKIIPLVPLYKIRPYKDGGTPEEVPLDPRPAFYAARKERYALQRSLDESLGTPTERHHRDTVAVKSNMHRSTSNVAICDGAEDSSNMKSPYRLIKCDNKVLSEPPPHKFSPVKIDLVPCMPLSGHVFSASKSPAAKGDVNEYRRKSSDHTYSSVADVHVGDPRKVIGSKVSGTQQYMASLKGLDVHSRKKTKMKTTESTHPPEQILRVSFENRPNKLEDIPFEATSAISEKTFTACLNKIPVQITSGRDNDSSDDSEAHKFLQRLSTAGMYKSDEEKNIKDEQTLCEKQSRTSDGSRHIDVERESRAVGIVKGVVQPSTSDEKDKFDLRHVLLNQRSNDDLRNLLGPKKSLRDLRDRLKTGRDIDLIDTDLESEEMEPSDDSNHGNKWSPSNAASGNENARESRRFEVTERIIETYQKQSCSSARLKRYASFHGTTTSSAEDAHRGNYRRRRSPSPRWSPFGDEEKSRGNNWKKSEKYGQGSHRSPSPSGKVYHRQKSMFSKDRSPTPPKQYSYSHNDTRHSPIVFSRSGSPGRKDRSSYWEKCDISKGDVKHPHRMRTSSLSNNSSASASFGSRPSSPVEMYKRDKPTTKIIMDKTKKFVSRHGEGSDKDLTDDFLFDSYQSSETPRDSYASHGRSSQSKAYNKYSGWDGRYFN